MQRRIASCIVLLASVGLLFVTPSDLRPSQSNGITRLITVTMVKAADANDQALRAAETQRALVKRQKTARDQARETAVLRKLEANASRTAEVLENVKAIQKYFQANPCK
jgi:hypothetical protein